MIQKLMLGETKCGSLYVEKTISIATYVTTLSATLKMLNQASFPQIRLAFAR